MTSDRYISTLHTLFSRAKSTGVDMGLKRMRAMSRALGIDLNNLSSIHVAGTNGKGSVVTKIARALEHSGKKVGLYTSPHISSFRERFQINGECISKDALCEYVDRILQVAVHLRVEPTFFEIATLLMFLWSQDEQCDLLVLETGLGGRLDATNICRPILTVITSIDLDHVEILGRTIPQIALEKAGIIKPSCPVVIGQSVPLEQIQTVAAHLNAPVIRVNAHGVIDFDRENSSLARCALEVLKEKIAIHESSIAFGIEQKPPCRYQKLEGFGVPVILDVAHNSHGVSALLKQVYEESQVKPVLLIGCSKEKDVASMVPFINEYGSHVILTQAKSYRAMPVAALAEHFSGMDITVEPQVTYGVKTALSFAKMLKIPLVIFGSFYIMTEVRQALGLAFECDDITVGEVWR